MTTTDDPAGEPSPGRYERYRRQIEDPSTREALLLQVRGTVQGLRSAYLVHLGAAILAIVALVIIAPGGFLETWRAPLIAGLLLLDLMALGGLRSAPIHPSRWILPVMALDLVLALGLTTLSAVHGEFSIAWLLLLVFPLMLVVHRRDARDIAALLAEHAAWRKTQAPEA
ncbi:MAG: hypothetical protein QNJ90_09345 [Planctomycetota bacterium]|nr:hypothetical protein [Planctomycetota bacterium]